MESAHVHCSSTLRARERLLGLERLELAEAARRVVKEQLEKQLEVVHGSAAWLGARQGVPGDVHRRFGHLRERGRERRGSGDRELGASGAPRERRVSALGSKVVSWHLRSQLTEKP